MFREIPNRSAICVLGTPSAANLRINAQSSKVITPQSLSAHFSTGRNAQNSTVIDNVTFTKPARLDFGEQVTCEPEFGRMDGALSRQLHRNRVLQ